ncbi:MAG TPA: asparagine synthase (glutamine-hydrolyzing) [Acidimicrobiales bacterium]|nr:asparagine synthase (glutamine-hydrolyzing) [Acidimicrobiales bacterium]
MCGIAGMLVGSDEPPADLDRLRAMLAAIAHRGPDGHGLFRDERVVLGHVRLSIVDLAGGFQPLTGEDRSVWLSFNGEIFNHVELRRELEALGHRFATAGDSEVIVHCYEQYGERAWSMLNGQFAFALWDRRAGALWLVRDRLGILPLHWARAGRQVVFASEAKALFAGGLVDPALDPAGLAQVFTRWSAMAPSTVFAGVRAVRPGSALRVDARDLGVTKTAWWQPDMAVDPRAAGLSPEAAAGELGVRLADAVRLRLRADVPVGAYLSGGLDSSVIGSLARQVDAGPLETFAVRFRDPAFDETVEQRRMAALLGTDHHEIVCGPDEIARSLADVVWHCESPLLRTAPVPLYLLSGLVRDAGMKVVLTGEGADELLAGYSIFKEDRVRRFWARRPDSAVRPALFSRLHPEVQAGGARASGMWARFFGRRLADTDLPFYAHLTRWHNTAWTLRMLHPDLRGPAGDDEALLAAMPPGWASWDPLARAQWVEIATFMSSYLLSCQGDRVAMAHGVEVRYPFLDPAVVDFCAGLPPDHKLAGLRDKVALRRLASRTLPPEIWRRPKQPYRAPMTSALFGPGEPGYVSYLMSDAVIDDLGLLDPRAARLLRDRARAREGHLPGEREEMALVGALTLQALGQAYLVDGRDRSAALAARFAAGPPPQVMVDLVGARPGAAAADRPGVDHVSSQRGG